MMKSQTHANHSNFLTIRKEKVIVFTLDMNKDEFINFSTGERGTIYALGNNQSTGQAPMLNEPSTITWSQFIETHGEKEKQKYFSFFHMGELLQITYKGPDGKKWTCRFKAIVFPRDVDDPEELISTDEDV